MEAKQVMRVLEITRQTLCRYVNNGLIRTEGRNNYNKEDVYNMLMDGGKRKIYLYARVPTKEFEKDLEDQLDTLKMYCKAHNISMNDVEIASGVGEENDYINRHYFRKIVKEVFQNKVQKVIAVRKEVISRTNFDFFNFVAKIYDCECITIETDNCKKELSELDKYEIIEDIKILIKSYFQGSESEMIKTANEMFEEFFSK